ncbi:hypothetical protein O181_041994 [Austropuccinia psidii MF-1]|uniref:Uncharacterized protein n=1 Tax=Austropuccinia psidii MF-1 TaxID=1389203 RepID=A0A9Q3DF81_9BASI|nr:hypothetical protein [Austropuccinia psidii MF-1]
MELPLSSDHDYLEELWNEGKEPEEIDTMMKVVPSAYHQYLDVLSKVKAEKLPPHHDCDHHIELEGSLPSTVSEIQRGFYHCSNPSITTIVETDASEYDSGKHPIEFDSRNLLPAGITY